MTRTFDGWKAPEARPTPRSPDVILSFAALGGVTQGTAAEGDAAAWNVRSTRPMELLAYVAAIGLGAWLALYLIGLITVPNPPGPIPTLKLVLQIVVVVFALWLLAAVFGLVPGPHPHAH